MTQRVGRLMEMGRFSGLDALFRTELADRRWSDAELCRRADITPSKMSRILGGGSMKVEDLEAILDAFEWSLCDLEVRLARYRGETPAGYTPVEPLPGGANTEALIRAMEELTKAIRADRP